MSSNHMISNNSRKEEEEEEEDHDLDEFLDKIFDSDYESSDYSPSNHSTTTDDEDDDEDDDDGDDEDGVDNNNYNDNNNNEIADNDEDDDDLVPTIVNSMTGILCFKLEYFSDIDKDPAILERIWHAARFVANSSLPNQWECRPRLVVAVSIPRILSFHAKETWNDLQDMLCKIYFTALNAADNADVPYIDVDCIFEEWCGYDIFTSEIINNTNLYPEPRFIPSVSPIWHYLGTCCEYDEIKLSNINSKRIELGLQPFVFSELLTRVKYDPINKSNLYSNIVEYKDDQLIAANSKLDELNHKRRKIISEGLKNGGINGIYEDYLNDIHKEEPVIVDGFNNGVPILNVDARLKFQEHSDEYYHKSRHNNVVLGGTFDHLHSGHKILLTVAAWLAGSSVLCGVMDLDNEKLLKKDSGDFIQPLNIRLNSVIQFLQTILRKKSINMIVMPITDALGPTADRSDLDAIVASAETAAGCDYVNEVRVKNDLLPLAIYLVDVISVKNIIPKLHQSGNYSDFSSKLSSSAIRRHLKEV